MAQDLTDTQWTFIEPLLPKLPKRADGRGRPWRDSRAVLNGILWILRTGAQWAELPRRYPPYQPAIAASSSGNGPASWSGCLRRWPGIWSSAARSSWTSALWTAVSQKGGAGVGKTKRGKGCKVMAIADRAGLPVALSTAVLRRMRRPSSAS